MSNAVISIVKEHPLAAGAVAVGVVVVVMLVTSGGEQAPESSANNGAGVAAYYAAVANQSQAGAAVQIAEVQANAQTNQTLIAATYGLEKDKIAGQVANHSLDVDSQVATQNYGVQLWAIDSNERMNFINSNNNMSIASMNANRDVKVAKAGGQSTGSQVAQVIGSVGNAAKSILPFF